MADGTAATRAEFIAAFGRQMGAGAYDRAKKAGGGAEEKRVAADGGSYTRDEFIAFYGRQMGEGAWRRARPAAAAAAPEKRLAADGTAYTRDEFIAFYGRQMGAGAWSRARPVPQAQAQQPSHHQQHPQVAPLDLSGLGGNRPEGHMMTRMEREAQEQAQFVLEWGS